MVKRAYNQNCPTAFGLDLVGDRWTLLIVRDLLLGPLRFTDLIARNAGIGRTLLKQRLDQMVEAGIVAAQARGEAAAHAYALTEKGQDLRPTVQAISRWSLRWHGPPAGPPNTPDLLGLALELCDPGGFFSAAVWEVRADPETVVHLRTDESGTRGARGPAQFPDFSLESQLYDLLPLFGGRVSDLKKAAGTLRVRGDRDAFVRVMKHLRSF